MPCTILIVDDSSTTRAIIKRTINMAAVPDVKIIEAPDGQTALKLLAEHDVTLVLADLHMPTMDGEQMLRQMRAEPRTANVPAVVVSAEPNESRLEGLRSLGILGYLRKPFTPEKLRDFIVQSMGAVHA